MSIFQDPKTRLGDRLVVHYILLIIALALLVGVLFVNSAYAQIEKPKQQWLGPIDYRVNDGCILASTYDLIDQAAREASVLSVPITKLPSVSNSFDRDGVNTAGCANANPFLQNALMIAEEGVAYTDYYFSSAGAARVWSYTATGGIMVQVVMNTKSYRLMNTGLGVRECRGYIKHGND